MEIEKKLLIHKIFNSKAKKIFWLTSTVSPWCRLIASS